MKTDNKYNLTRKEQIDLIGNHLEKLYKSMEKSGNRDEYGITEAFFTDRSRIWHLDEDLAASYLKAVKYNIESLKSKTFLNDFQDFEMVEKPVITNQTEVASGFMSKIKELFTGKQTQR